MMRGALGAGFALAVALACKPRGADQSALRSEQSTTPSTTACSVIDTPTLLSFIEAMRPTPTVAADVYKALRDAGCPMSTEIGILSERSVQPAHVASRSPRSFVTVNGKAILSTGPEGRIEVATFPLDPTGQRLPTTDEQFADVEFHGGQLAIKAGAEKAGCDSCHFGFVPVPIGEDEDGTPTPERPFPLREWHDQECPDHPMCRNIRAMIGLD